MSLSPKPSSKSKGTSRPRIDSDKEKGAGEVCKTANLREGHGDMPASAMAAASGSISSSATVAASSSHSGITQDLDLFSSILSGMGHLSAGGAHQPQAAASQVQASLPHVGSRKRKFLEQHSAAGSGKMNGIRPPFLRRNSEDEAAADHVGALHTPLVSQSGYADEEDRHNQSMDNPTTSAGSVAAAGHHHSLLHSMSGSGTGGGGSVRSGSGSGRMGILSPGGNLISDIDDNLASNFDDSLSGLGVDIHGGNYSVSEALLALPNLSISSSQIFKQEMVSLSNSTEQQEHSASSSRTHKMLKDEPLSRPMSGEPEHMVSKNYGALDLSNEEAHLPDSSNSAQGLNGAQGRRDFIGSVSRESSMGATNLDKKKDDREEGLMEAKDTDRARRTTISQLQSPSSQVPIAVASSSNAVSSRMAKEKPGASSANSGNGSSSRIEKFERLNESAASSDKFQYILAASTSLATKISEPTITYLNQGQAYELRLKKLGDLSAYRKRQLRSVIRICFHERRLQYMEAEQISDWRNAHAGERILDLDLPLSYGIAPEEPYPSSPINVISFRWDPTRETGVFVKVNCISTEFTLKKHGGEKGVPFRLQLETYDGDIRLHAASCILQVFKLKGADRKHKQDKEKVSKRPPAEQEKFAPSYDCTVLTDLSVDSIYVPPAESPTRQARDPGKAETPVPIKKNNSRPTSPKVMQEDLSSPSLSHLTDASETSMIQQRKSQTLPISKNELTTNTDLSGQPIAASASSDVVAAWLSSNRYAANICRDLRSFSARDLMRLTREELIHICGTASGIRLYNDLHLAVVVPKTTLYVAAHGSHEYSALFLEERTLDELVRCLSEAIGVTPTLFSRIYMVGPMPNMLIRVTDEVVQYTKPDSAFHFSLRQQHEQQGGIVNDVILESVFMSSAHSSQESLHRTERLGGVASTRNSIEENLNVVSRSAAASAGDTGHLVDPLASDPTEHEQLRRHRS